MTCCNYDRMIIRQTTFLTAWDEAGEDDSREGETESIQFSPDRETITQTNTEIVSDYIPDDHDVFSSSLRIIWSLIYYHHVIVSWLLIFRSCNITIIICYSKQMLFFMSYFCVLYVSLFSYFWKWGTRLLLIKSLSLSLFLLCFLLLSLWVSAP